MVVDVEVKNSNEGHSLRSGWGGLLKNDLTGPTLLEISDRELSVQRQPSSL